MGDQTIEQQEEEWMARYPIEESVDGVVWWFTGDEPPACAHGIGWEFSCHQCEDNQRWAERRERELNDRMRLQSYLNHL